MLNPRLSIIIPTYNERENILPLIDLLLAKQKDVEIIVVDAAASSDGTLDVIQRECVVKISSQDSSRAKQLQAGAQMAKANTLYFVHADTRPPVDYCSHIEQALAGSKQFGLFSYRFDSDSKLLAFNSRFTKRDGVFTGGGDQSLFIKKSVFDEHGGFDVTLPIMEDFDFYWRLKNAGVPFVILSEEMLVSARKYEHNSYLKVQWINLVTLLGFKWGRDPFKLKQFYSKALG